MSDFYSILGVGKESTPDDIKKSYRKMALEYHPDKHPDEKKEEMTKKFSEISEAHRVLSDPESKQIYDNRNNEPQFSGFSGSGHPFGASEIFEHFFKDAGFNPFRNQSSLINETIPISLKEVLEGSEKTIKSNINILCTQCLGNRIDPTKPKLNDMYAACLVCKGNGSIKEDKEFKVSVPSGIPNGAAMRIPLEGTMQTILFKFVYNMSDKLKTDGQGNVSTTIHLTYPELILGTNKVFNSFDGEEFKIKIPKRTNNGQVIRLKNKGLPEGIRSPTRGDLFLRVEILVPTISNDLIASEEALLTQINDLYKRDNK